MTRVDALVLEGEPEVWRSLGLTVTDEGVIPLFGACLRLVAPAVEPRGIVGWELSGTPGVPPEDVDGLATRVVTAADPVFADHPNGAIGLDHLVVLTGDLERTSTAINEATGCELKRIREVGSMRQGFHRIGGGGLIVEIVERPEVDAPTAVFWGLVLNVDDLDAACDRLGDLIGPAKDAVQHGRRIATVREDAGLGLPVAFMTP